ncbi:uncharacterized protein BJ171DRAFT_606663 [Polychytrium aggregatum]|uniref:uncharacterized protein n=1 Tax=Polychytrium aggregatum TaxID=110093 RepID=UPI0022FE679E|nr:uncharacterized protein BJ171DRAFT_606663 [Polychytrium aggregatum]KAI9190715.1 hypothetical protein BJ171DRAFT_606663 [Polychytrium aggregatum]
MLARSVAAFALAAAWGSLQANAQTSPQCVSLATADPCKEFAADSVVVPNAMGYTDLSSFNSLTSNWLANAPVRYQCPTFNYHIVPYFTSVRCGLEVDRATQTTSTTIKCNGNAAPAQICASSVKAMIAGINQAFAACPAWPDSSTNLRTQDMNEYQTLLGDVTDSPGCISAISYEQYCGYFYLTDAQAYCAQTTTDPCCKAANMGGNNATSAAAAATSATPKISVAAATTSKPSAVSTSAATDSSSSSSSTSLFSSPAVIGGIAGGGALLLGGIVAAVIVMRRRKANQQDSYDDYNGGNSYDNRQTFAYGDANNAAPQTMYGGNDKSMYGGPQTMYDGPQTMYGGNDQSMYGGPQTMYGGNDKSMYGGPQTMYDGPDAGQVSETMEVIYNYTANLSDEIQLNIGDTIIVKCKFDDGWAFGFNVSTSQEGSFPLACVDVPNGGSGAPRKNEGIRQRASSLYMPAN